MNSYRDALRGDDEPPLDRGLEPHRHRQDLRPHRPARPRRQRVPPGRPDQRQHPGRGERGPPVPAKALQAPRHGIASRFKTHPPHEIGGRCFDPHEQGAPIVSRFGDVGPHEVSGLLRSLGAWVPRALLRAAAEGSPSLDFETWENWIYPRPLSKPARTWRSQQLPSLGVLSVRRRAESTPKPRGSRPFRSRSENRRAAKTVPSLEPFFPRPPPKQNGQPAGWPSPLSSRPSSSPSSAALESSPAPPRHPSSRSAPPPHATSRSPAVHTATRDR